MQLPTPHAVPSALQVSVPSTGRSGLQPELHHETQKWSKVSVPSTGRSGLQPKGCWHNALDMPVSVPSTGRSGLQQEGGRDPKEGAHVSVPSTGRSGLQHENFALSCIMFAGFSTLYGSKWVAIQVFTLPSGSVVSFSTLYGSKWVATRRVCAVQVSTPQFQYPLRVEVGCNEQPSAASAYLDSVSVPSTGRSGLQAPEARNFWKSA